MKIFVLIFWFGLFNVSGALISFFTAFVALIKKPADAYIGILVQIISTKSIKALSIWQANYNTQLLFSLHIL